MEAVIEALASLSTEVPAMLVEHFLGTGFRHHSYDMNSA